jgi:DNA repair exonuclease SbcCD ATPase subunit/DNA repair exonuclease SbcCD nuclease subunit
MRFIHTSDEHVELRPAEIDRAIGFVAETAEASHADLIVSAGDWYHGTSRPDDRNRSIVLQQRLRRAAPLLLVAGNHGQPADLVKFRTVEGEHPVHVATEPEIVFFARAERPFRAGFSRDAEVGAKAGAILVACLPWLRKADLVHDGEGDVGARALAALRAILDGFIATIKAHPGPSIVVVHGDVARDRRSPGNPEVGEELVIPVAWLSELIAAGASYVALGHEHDAQVMAPAIEYSGTPAPTTFGEVAPKGFNLVEIEPYRGAPASISFIRTPVAPLATVTAVFEGGELRVTSTGTPPPGARVRVTYRTDEHERAAARIQAEKLKQALLAAGAADVRLDPPTVIPVVRSRGGDAVARARSTWEKLLAFFQATGQDVGPPTLARLELLLSRTEAGVGAARAQVVPPALRVDGIRVRGIGVFRDEVAVRFAGLGPLVAITGENGAGKSTLAGLIYGGMYRQHPDGWDLVSRALGKDSLVELDVVNGHAWRLRLGVNGRSRKMEGFVYDDAGNLADATLARGLTTSFDKWVSEHLPPADLYRATAFAAQLGGGDPIVAKPADLKQRFVELLGLDYLERLAEWVRAQVRPKKGVGLDAQAAQIRGAITTAQGGAVPAERAEAEHEVAARAVAEAEQAHAVAEEAVEAARLALAEWERVKGEIEGRGREARAVEDAATRRLATAEEALAAAAGRTRKSVDRVGELARRVEGAAEVEAAEAALPQLRQAVIDSEAAAARAAAQVEVAEQELRRGRDEEQAARRALDVARADERARADALAARVGDVGKAEDAARDLPAAEREAGRLPALEQEHAAAQGEHQRAADEARRSEEFDRGQAQRIDAASQRAARAERERADAARAAGDLAAAESAATQLPDVRERLAESRRLVDDITDRVRRSNEYDAEQRRRAEQAASDARAAAQEHARGRAAVEAVNDVPCGGPAAQPTCKFLVDAGAVDLVALADAETQAQAAARAVLEEPAPSWYIATARPESERGAKQALRDLEVAEQRLAPLAARLDDLRIAADRARAAAAERDAARAEEDAIRQEEAPTWYIGVGERDGRTRTAAEEVARIDRLVNAARGARARLPDLQRAAEGAAAARHARDEAERARSAAADAVRAAVEEHERREADLGAAEDESERVRGVKGEADVAVDGARAALAEAERNAARAEGIAQARADLQAAERQLAADRDGEASAQTERDRAAAAVGAAKITVSALLGEHKGHLERRPRDPDVAGVARARETVTAARGRLAVAAERLSDARAAAEEVTAMERQLAGILDQIADCDLLASALGKDGLQAMEIDAAAPAISELVSTLIAECFGPRFAIGLETQREAVDGKKVIEGMQIRVLDTEREVSGEAKDVLSGGERVLVGLGFRLATAIYAVQVSGAPVEATIVMDEPDRGLRGDNDQRFVAMLRRAMAIGGFRQAILVPDHPTVAELCDNRVHVADGHVEVR